MSLDEINSSDTTLNRTSVVKTLVKFLDKVYGAVAEFIIDENGSARCLFFQDPSMKDVFNFYPDRICIDSTYKHFEIDLFIYVFMCEDSNGRNFIIAISFLQANDVESLVWLFNTFKKHNPNWRKIKSMAIDPEIKPREIVRELFPHPLIIICYFHAYTSFKNDVNGLRELGVISEDQKLHANDLFKNMYFSHNQSEFELHYSLFLELPCVVVSYFQDVWLPKQHEWRIPLDFAHENVFLNINCFLQELTDGIRAIYTVESSYVEFIKKMFLFILLKKKEKPSMFIEPVSFLYSRFSPEHQISKSLTPYAAKFVIVQLDLSSEISAEVNGVSDTYIFDYLGISISASSSACSCHFFLFTLLPCRHIFAVRKINHLCAFDKSLVDYAWNMEYYQHTIACMQDYIHQGTNIRIPQDPVSRTSLASHLFEVCTSSILDAPKDTFESRFRILKKLVQTWKMDENICLHFRGVEDIKDTHQRRVFAAGSSFDPGSSGTNSLIAAGSSFDPGSSGTNSLIAAGTSTAPNFSLNSIPSPDPSSVIPCTTVSHSLIPNLSPDVYSSIVSNASAPCSSFVPITPPPCSSIIPDASPPCSSIVSSVSPSFTSTIHNTSPPCSSFLPNNSPDCSSTIHPIIPVSCTSIASCSPVISTSSFVTPNSLNICSSSPCPSPIPSTSTAQCSIDLNISNQPCSSNVYYRSENVTSSQEAISLNKVIDPLQCRYQQEYERNSRPILSNFNTTILSSNYINLAYIINVICNTKTSCVEWLRRMQFLPDSMKCPVCGGVMMSKTVLRLSDGVVWSCNNVGENKKCCSKRCSVRVGSWFELANMTFEQILIFCYMWLNKFGKNRITCETNISASTYVTWDKFCKRICQESVPSSIYRNPLDRWLELNAGTDTFMKFLKDATTVHQRDLLKTSVKSDGE